MTYLIRAMLIDEAPEASVSETITLRTESLAQGVAELLLYDGYHVQLWELSEFSPPRLLLFRCPRWELGPNELAPDFELIDEQHESIPSPNERSHIS